MQVRESALEIYDEVIASMPRHEMAAIATFRKGRLLVRLKDHKLAIETFQTLIRRYPKHPLASDSYLAIANVFLKQSQQEYPDAELIDRADLNLEKFKNHFPGEPRIADAEAISLNLREQLASELYFLGDFYERTKKPRAAAIYYSNIVTKFPNDIVCEQSKKATQRAERGICRNKSQAREEKSERYHC